MTLLELQQLFAQLVGGLISWICTHPNWAVTVGDFNRPDEQGHMANSCHYIRLAADLNLFVDGEWKQEDCEEWQAIGLYWKGLHYLCRWGGDFSSVDLNHFSISYEGRS